MAELEFTMNVSAPKKQLFDKITDYEQYPTYLPDQLRSVKVIEKNDNVVITEESIIFSNWLSGKVINLRSKVILNVYTGYRFIAIACNYKNNINRQLIVL